MVFDVFASFLTLREDLAYVFRQKVGFFGFLGQKRCFWVFLVKKRVFWVKIMIFRVFRVFHEFGANRKF